MPTTLVQAANTGAQTTTYLGSNTAASLEDVAGNGQAIAVAHSILVIAYHLIARQESYRDLSANYFDFSRPEATTKRSRERLLRRY